MKFKNKILKLSLRYAKEKGLYNTCIKHLKEIIKEVGNNEENLINACQYQTPLLILQRASIIKEDIYSNDFVKYICDMEQEKYIKLFDDFLETHAVKEKYYKRLNCNFIKKHLKYYYPSDEMFNIEPFEILKMVYPPTGYIMHAFHWQETTEGHNFWSKLNSQWIMYFISYIKENS